MKVGTDLGSPASRALRVIFLAFEFPPLASGGVHRALGFAQTLPPLGIDLDIVTVREADYRSWTRASIDPALSARIPKNVRVHQIASGFPAWYWVLASNRAGFRLTQYGYWGDPVAVFWRHPLFALLDRLVVDRRPDVLLATAPPFGVAVLALQAARRYRLPWVVDFRDAWTRWCVAPYPTIGHYLYTRRAERQALRHANIAVATSHVTREDWLTDTPDLDPNRLVTIYNGYDGETTFDGSKALTPREKTRTLEVQPGDTNRSHEIRRIVYVGSFYYTPEARTATYRPLWRRRPDQWLQYRFRREDWLYRSPYFFLRGLARFRQRCPDIASRIRVTFLGHVPKWMPEMLAATGTADVVDLPGPVSHAESLRLVRESSAVLLTSAKVEDGKDYSIAGKMYEYFAARAPIVAVLTPGAMRDLVEQSGLGLLADPDDTESVATAIERVARADDPRRLVSPNEPFIRGFARSTLSSAMAGCLRQAAAEGPRP